MKRRAKAGEFPDVPASGEAFLTLSLRNTEQMLRPLSIVFTEDGVFLLQHTAAVDRLLHGGCAICPRDLPVPDGCFFAPQRGHRRNLLLYHDGLEQLYRWLD